MESEAVGSSKPRIVAALASPVVVGHSTRVAIPRGDYTDALDTIHAFISHAHRLQLTDNRQKALYFLKSAGYTRDSGDPSRIIPRLLAQRFYPYPLSKV